nr:putative ORF1 [Barns Ness breadcrumb sponge tombus-like virus 2]
MASQSQTRSTPTDFVVGGASLVDGNRVGLSVNGEEDRTPLLTPRPPPAWSIREGLHEGHFAHQARQHRPKPLTVRVKPRPPKVPQLIGSSHPRTSSKRSQSGKSPKANRKGSQGASSARRGVKQRLSSFFGERKTNGGYRSLPTQDQPPSGSSSPLHHGSSNSVLEQSHRSGPSQTPPLSPIVIVQRGSRSPSPSPSVRMRQARRRCNLPSPPPSPLRRSQSHGDLATADSQPGLPRSRSDPALPPTRPIRKKKRGKRAGKRVQRRNARRQNAAGGSVPAGNAQPPPVPPRGRRQPPPVPPRGASYAHAAGQAPAQGLPPAPNPPAGVATGHFLGADTSGHVSWNPPTHHGASSYSTAREAITRNGTVDVNAGHLPVKTNCPQPTDPSKPIGYCARKVCRKTVGQIDLELRSYLQYEALFKPRTPELLLLLKHKADQFLRGFNTMELTWQWRLEHVTGAVAFAMDISTNERIARQHLKNGSQCEERKKQAKLLQQGDAGRTGLFVKKNHPLPKTA